MLMHEGAIGKSDRCEISASARFGCPWPSSVTEVGSPRCIADAMIASITEVDNRHTVFEEKRWVSV